MHLRNSISRLFHLFLLSALFLGCASEKQSVREKTSLNQNWKSIAHDSLDHEEGFHQKGFDDSGWTQVDVPHNWDQYAGYRRMNHGNRHGYAWYRKTFEVEARDESKQYFLRFEGVGSYAHVWVNGEKVGQHDGGRTSFTLDITEAVNPGEENLLAVRADHPAFIRDLPWVCGGCSEEIGFSEGSQPMGIHRPVQLIVTNNVKIEPFGVHIWNDTTVSEDSADVNINTEVKNYGGQPRTVTVKHQLKDTTGKVVTETESEQTIEGGQKVKVKQTPPTIMNPTLWDLENPYLYTLETKLLADGVVLDRDTLTYGIRWVSWPQKRADGNQFLLNGEPVFINGTCEYEHMIGMSHAFSAEQVKARVMQMRSAGFNAFRDAHQPHNLRYGKYWKELGMLWWTQMGAHIWFDNPDFRENFKARLRDWVKERRNNPAVMMWGLQNESQLPTDFAQECTNIIRELDPTALGQRLVTTCNGGTGTDWNVPQNWSGTYGGNPDIYDEEIQEDLLFGEYGGWRTLDLHTDKPEKEGLHSENDLVALMEKKVRLAESAKDNTCGHFQWIFATHDNPGRNQSGEAYRSLDRIGPVNYKGLLTHWGEPADLFYMYRSNYAPQDTEPMVYIVSHTWPSRWTETGVKDSISVYSNCDSVELLNGVDQHSFGKTTKNGIGTHFYWKDVEIQNNLLHAVGYVDGEKVAHDYIILNHLPESPEMDKLKEENNLLEPAENRNYIYRVNSGGPDYEDTYGNTWHADVHQKSDSTWGSVSWGDEFEKIPSFFASQRRTFDPITNTQNGDLFRTFRYGKQELEYNFPVPNGEYRVEFFFTEPWYGTGGNMNCTDWRLFDVAVNGEVVIDDLDIWKETGHDKGMKKTATVEVNNGNLNIDFPEVKSGQAVLSGIAISTTDDETEPAPGPKLIENAMVGDSKAKVQKWADLGDRQYIDGDFEFSKFPPDLFGTEWIQTSSDRNPEDSISFSISSAADVYVALDSDLDEKPSWIEDFGNIDTRFTSYNGESHEFRLYKKRFQKGEQVAFPGASGNGGNPYTVFASQASDIQPAFDLKPKKDYNADIALLKGDNMEKGKKYGFGNVIYNDVSGDTIEWEVNIGVADYYAFHVKFSNETGKEASTRFRLIASDGEVMQDQLLNYRITPKTKYRLVTTTTETMVNAGEYRVQLISKDAKGLRVRGIRVQ